MTLVITIRKIIRTTRRRFEKIHIDKLKRSHSTYVGQCKELYIYFSEIYEEWQASGSDVFPSLVLVHSTTEKDELDVQMMRAKQL